MAERNASDFNGRVAQKQIKAIPDLRARARPHARTFTHSVTHSLTHTERSRSASQAHFGY